MLNGRVKQPERTSRLKQVEKQKQVGECPEEEGREAEEARRPTPEFPRYLAFRLS